MESALNARVPPGYTYPSWLPAVFVTMQVLGGIGSLNVLVIVLLTPHVRRHRHPLWINFFVTSIIYSISYSLLLFDPHPTGSEPPFGLCLSQTAISAGAPSMVASATFALVAHLWVNVRHAGDQSLDEAFPTRASRWRTVSLLGLPYLVMFAMVIDSLVAGLAYHSPVTRVTNGPYCHFTSGTQGRINAVLVICIMLASLVLEAHIVMTFYQASRQLKLLHSIARFNRNGLSKSLLIRVIIFTFFGMISIGTSILWMHPSTAFLIVLPHLLLALMPIAAFLVFGTYKDIFYAMLFWRRGLSGADQDDMRSGGSHAPLGSMATLEDLPDLKVEF